MKTKKTEEYSFLHTQKRMWERYSLTLNQDEYDALCERVRRFYSPIAIEKQKNETQEIYVITYKLKKIRAVFSRERNLITTVIPEKGIKNVRISRRTRKS